MKNRVLPGLILTGMVALAGTGCAGYSSPSFWESCPCPNADLCPCPPRSPRDCPHPEPESADLVPVPQATPPALPESFCKRVEASLFVRVMNQGSGPAGPSMTAVEFEDLGRFSEPTVTLASGQSTELRFTISEGCFGPGAGEICNFTITVDDMAVVAESNEGNNVANGSCGIAL